MFLFLLAVSLPVGAESELGWLSLGLSQICCFHYVRKWFEVPNLISVFASPCLKEIMWNLGPT